MMSQSGLHAKPRIIIIMMVEQSPAIMSVMMHWLFCNIKHENGAV